LIDKDAITGKDGEIEHLRPHLNKAYKIQANELIWMTDRTPHQAIRRPKKSGYHQVFRLVPSNLREWHSQHYTPNPNVALPPSVEVIDSNRFEGQNYNGSN